MTAHAEPRGVTRCRLNGAGISGRRIISSRDQLPLQQQQQQQQVELGVNGGNDS